MPSLPTEAEAPMMGAAAQDWQLTVLTLTSRFPEVRDWRVLETSRKEMELLWGSWGSQVLL